MRIYDIIPDAETLIELSPEDLAYHLLQVAHENLQNNMVHRDLIISIEQQPGDDRPYPMQQEHPVQICLSEALLCLESNSILLPAPGVNGTNGFRLINPRRQDLLNKEQFHTFQQASAFPKTLLHSRIANLVWSDLLKGNFTDAVFKAFRTVEEEVRSAGNYSNVDIGVDLMHKAFAAKKGPLTDTTTTRS